MIRIPHFMLLPPVMMNTNFMQNQSRGEKASNDSSRSTFKGGLASERERLTERVVVSQRIGELVLLPTVRQASEEEVIVADGFSCRQQIAQATNRRAFHTAEVLHFALQNGGQSSASAAQSEARYFLRHHQLGKPRRILPWVAAAIVVSLFARWARARLRQRLRAAA
jgi:hypothetical protein